MQVFLVPECTSLWKKGVVVKLICMPGTIYFDMVIESVAVFACDWILYGCFVVRKALCCLYHYFVTEKSNIDNAENASLRVYHIILFKGLLLLKTSFSIRSQLNISKRNSRNYQMNCRQTFQPNYFWYTASHRKTVFGRFLSQKYFKVSETIRRHYGTFRHWHILCRLLAFPN